MTASGALRSLSSTASRSRAPRSTTGTGGGGHSEKPSRDISDWAHELEESRRRGWRAVTGKGGERGSKTQDRRKKWVNTTHGGGGLKKGNGILLVFKTYLESRD